jgi:hypothetical protein
MDTYKGLADIVDIRGAAPDRSCFYSTSSSIAQADWLPILRSKFNLHLNTATKHNTKVPTLPKFKKESGYSKNCSSFVPYDPSVDEGDIKSE